MSGPILENLDYLRLLLNTSKIQGEALLDTATPDQIRTISQIVRNLKVISVEPAISEILNKTNIKKLLKKLKKKSSQVRVKGKLISKRRKLILSILMGVKPALIGVIDEIRRPSNVEYEGIDISENK